MLRNDELVQALRHTASGLERLAIALTAPDPTPHAPSVDGVLLREAYMNKNQVADYLGVTPRTLTNWMKRGFPHTRVFGTVRFTQAAVDAWMGKHERGRLA